MAVLLAQLWSFTVAAAPIAAGGDGWQNGNGASTTATGQASTPQPALVFAFDTGTAVTGCTSPQGACSVGQPDGAASFEVFAPAPISGITFSVTTATPIACSDGLQFKASFDGSSYAEQPAVPSANDCPATPPSPCPVSNVAGYFEPTQGVWQDDPLDAPRHFPDKPGKRLVQNGPNDYTAELPMVVGKPMLLFGIDHTQAGAPKDRNHIVITGTTTGTTPVSVAMLFSADVSPGNAQLRSSAATPVLGSIDLDGPCGPPHDFRIVADATLGQPWQSQHPALAFVGSGPYTLIAELRREDGDPTAIEVRVHGRAVATTMPRVAFVPMRFVDQAASPCIAPPVDAQTASDRLADASALNIPDSFPLRPGGFPVAKGRLIDARAAVADELSSWTHWAATKAHLATDARTTQDVLLALLTDSTQLGSVLGRSGRTVVVLNPCEMAALGGLLPGTGFVGLAVSPKVLFVRNGEDWTTVAHEVAHTMPYVWSSSQMTAQCDVDYHNTASGNAADSIAHGFAVTQRGIEDRSPRNGYHSIMGATSGSLVWTDQCTYANLARVLQDPPDPPVLYVRGRIARSAGAEVGELLPAYELDGTVDMAPGGSGAWAIVTRDASGSEIARYPFDPAWSPPDSGRDLQVTSFGYRIPASAAIASVDLVGPSGVTSTLRWSAHAPRVTITAPRTNTVVTPPNGTVHVTWAAADPDGGALLATVLVSDDDGTTWQATSVEQRGTSADVPLGPGLSHRIRVVVTDGARSVTAETAVSTETPAQLVARIAAAYRSGTGATLLGRLDPAVIARYGSAQCRSYLAGVHDPTLRYVLRSMSGPAPWVWVSDGRAARIPAVFTLAVTQTRNGRQTAIAIHVSIRTGRLGYFADCGKPLGP